MNSIYHNNIPNINEIFLSFSRTLKSKSSKLATANSVAMIPTHDFAPVIQQKTLNDWNGFF